MTQGGFHDQPGESGSERKAGFVRFACGTHIDGSSRNDEEFDRLEIYNTDLPPSDLEVFRF